MTTIPAEVQRVLDAIASGDSDAFVAAFGPDGGVDDWGREFRGPERVRQWSDGELIGVQATLSDIRGTASGDTFTVEAQVGGNGFNGPSHFAFRLRDGHIDTMTITA
jgi:hypothetical protein